MKTAKERQRVAEFLGKAILKYHDKSIHFSPQRYLKVGNVSCVGWATEDGIKIATGEHRWKWLGWFVHETCHLDQNKCKPKWFESAEVAINDFEDWLRGRRIKNIQSIVKKVIRLEHDCEQRTLRKISTFKLPIDQQEYAQQANSYLLGYYQSALDRQWCKRSYEDDNVWKAMPKKLIPLKLALKPTPSLLKPLTE
jgi:hypothetical protein